MSENARIVEVNLNQAKLKFTVTRLSNGNNYRRDAPVISLILVLK